ncbi:MAG: prepilin-type N-terminal cleavage/methylation domain-containing protein, partial [Candidatus Nanosynbacter sp.]|nr:prepilin-type N-terminal cleavage/methylation domain-containing protein [Candidatus Nanosynbacter sp.]
MTTKQLKNRGFTLVELLIVIVIIAILTVISL